MVFIPTTAQTAQQMLAHAAVALLRLLQPFTFVTVSHRREANEETCLMLVFGSEKIRNIYTQRLGNMMRPLIPTLEGRSQ